MLETIFAFLGAIVGFGTCAILNALKDKPKQIDVSKELEHLTDQVYGCKNKIDILIDKSDLERKGIYDEFAELKQEIEYFQHIQGINGSMLKQIINLLGEMEVLQNGKQTK